MASKPFRLVPGRDVFLAPLGYGNEVRFARVFRSAWLRLPYGSRFLLLGFWRDCDAGRTGIVASPRVELQQDWPGRTPDIWGFCSHHGHFLRFHAGTVDRMPERIGRALVFHELAHAFCSAINDPAHARVFRLGLKWGSPDAEKACLRILRRWGLMGEQEKLWEWRRGNQCLA